ncbi:MAG: type VI secretion system contractile sheath large subunit, partial [Gammaproteobacteria bacterium]|nr:type VI secretion system contractile sheath large subunit [Gammaproteobacteria bacterium]
MPQAKKSTKAAVKNEESVDILEQAIAVTKNTSTDRATELLKSFTTEALKGTLSFDKNLTKTVQDTIKKIDEQISQQLSAIMHTPKFTKLEGSWRGLTYLLKNTAVGRDLKIKLLNASKKELSKNFNKAMDFDQSELFKKLYEYEYGTPGGEPYGTLIGDYEFGNNPEDLDLLENISHVAAASFCPFISAANASMIGLDKWTDLSKPRDLEKIINSVGFAKWRGLRDSADASFVSLTMPRVLARVPYGTQTCAAETFNFE